MALIDHLFVFLLLVVQPIHGARSYQRYIDLVKKGATPNRLGLYNQIIVVEWLAVAFLGLVWVSDGRSMEAIGFNMQIGEGFWWSMAAISLACGYLVFTMYRIRQLPETETRKHINDLGDLLYLLPQNQREFNRFTWVSLTAGVCEEIIYRGFLIWYLSHFTPLWLAVLLSSVVFGLGHTYQGVKGVLKVIGVGLAFALLYVISGSIWLPILAHALFDILQGALVLELLNKRDVEDKKSSE